VSGLAATLARRRRRLLSIPRIPALSPRLKRRLLALLVVSLVLVGGYQFWLRDSSLVAVEEVKISGLTTADAPRVRSSLAAVAKDMTTLNIDQQRLERAVEAYPAVRELEVTPEFPHALRVRVIEHVPAAMAVSDAGQVAVAGDGTILRGLPVEGELPTVAVDGILGAERLRDADARAAAAVAGAAPAVLRGRIDEVAKRTEQGLVATLRDGPELIFGPATQLTAKWAAAARVLADREARGASYIDLRLAGRPAAGGLPAQTVTPVAPAGTAPPAPTAPGPETTTDPSAAQAPTEPTSPIDTVPGATPTTPGETTATPPSSTAVPPATTPPPSTPAPVPGNGAEGGVVAPTAP
jgi:cell division protein FtsQ